MSVRKNTLWNVAGSAVPLVPAVLLIPYTLHGLGDSGFGVLTLVWAAIGYFSLFDMGIGRSLTLELSRIHGADETSRLRPTLVGGMLLTAGAGCVGALILFVTAPFLVRDWLKIEPSLQADALLAFQITSFGVIATTLSSGIRGALEGLQRFALSNLNKMGLGLCTFALPALSIWWHGPSLPVICAYLVGTRVVITVLAALPLRRVLSGSGDRLSTQHVRRLFGLGSWLTVTGLVGPLMTYGDRFFVSTTVGVALLPLYSIPQEGLQRLLILPGALTGALLPYLSGADPMHRSSTFRAHYRRIAIVMFCVCAAANVVAFPFLSWWLSEDFAGKALPIIFVLTIGIWLNSMAMAPYTLLHAAGNPRITALFHLFELALYVVALWWLTARFGLIGAAVAWALRAALDLALLHGAAQKLVQRTL
jgi:O-antigen/teichoic acid export membrane protein